MTAKNIPPESDFSNYKDNAKVTTHPPDKIAWSRVLDCRYGMEVKRIEPYKGLWVMYDLDNNNKILHLEEVAISYDAKFGPDALDASNWSYRGIEIVDKL